MKKFFAVFVLAGALTACGGNSEEGSHEGTDETTVNNAHVDSNVVGPAVNDTAASGGSIQDTSTTVIDTPKH